MFKQGQLRTPKWIVLIIMMGLLPGLACALSAASNTSPSTGRVALSANRPTVIFLAPPANRRFAVGAEVLIHVLARDVGSGITRIEVYDNFDEIIETITAPNAQGVAELEGVITWVIPSAQRHFLRATAFRADDTQSNTAEIAIEGVAVSADTPLLPAVSLLEIEANDDAANATIPPSNATPATANPSSAADDSGLTTPGPTLDAPTPTPDNRLTATVIGATALNIRVGPGVSAQIVGTAQQGDTLDIAGRSEDNQWYITPRLDGSSGWVYGQYLQFDGDPATLPIIPIPN